jgi:hypothetical protein
LERESEFKGNFSGSVRGFVSGGGEKRNTTLKLISYFPPLLVSALAGAVTAFAPVRIWLTEFEWQRCAFAARIAARVAFCGSRGCQNESSTVAENANHARGRRGAAVTAPHSRR